MVQFLLPSQVKFIIDTLTKKGFEAFAVGGCVRDSLLQKQPKDWDITTCATPIEVKSIFHRTIDTGIAHGTVTVMIDGVGYEVTTYRVDGEYEDGRHPKAVEFTSNLIEDLKRRDFTINSMAYNEDMGLVDSFDGIGDLKRQMIRCVGNARERFEEDALRMLRAIRFSAQLGFSIEEKTFRAIKELAGNMALVSKERIFIELVKILMSPHPRDINVVKETGLAPFVSPTFERVFDQEVILSHELPEKKHIRIAACFKGLSGDEAYRILKDLKADGDTINKVRILVSNMDRSLVAEKKAIRLEMSLLGVSLFQDLLEIQKSFGDENKVEVIEAVYKLVEEILQAGDCLTLRELAVRGTDLMELGIKPGKHLGEVLNHLLNKVLEQPEYNERTCLLEMAKLMSR